MNMISLSSLNKVLETLEEGILLLDQKRNVVAINQAAINMIGQNRKRILGALCPSIFPGTPCAQTCESSGKCSLMEGAGKDDKLVQDIAVVRPDGALIPLHMWATGLPPNEPLAHCAVVLRNRSHEVHLEEMAGRRMQLGGLVGYSRVMQIMFREILLAAASEANVLVTGESGTGKELVAQAIHDNSNRAKGPYVQVHCAALPENLLEAELFGHTKGAFTGAVADRPGRFEAASGGTLLLDEIGEVPLSTQVKLLRVLQEKEVVRLGENQPRKVDVRIIAATHRDLAAMVQSGEFRADLYYRLRVLPLHVPPLRDRREGLPILANSILSNLASHYKRSDVALAQETVDALLAYDWPGNVRELVNALEYALVHADGASILPRHLPPELRNAAPADPDTLPEGRLAGRVGSGRFSQAGGFAANVSAPAAALPRTEKAAPLLRYYRPPAQGETEKDIIANALKEAGGNRGAAAERLGMSRTTLWKRLKQYGLE